MATFAELLKARQSSQSASTGGFAGLLRNRMGAGQSTTTTDLRQQVADLELLQQQTGARQVEQDKPGAFRKIIDFLQRPNFAIAGFAEEILGQEPSVSRGVTRALSEIFSGVGGIEGEKRAFGEVMENLGVGTTTLADAFPVLEGTWVGAFGSRGAAGLALDIVTDPLTYMTFGASTGARIATSKGIRYINKFGLEEMSKLEKAAREPFLDAMRKAAKTGNDSEVTRILTRARTEAEDAFEAAFSKGGDLSEEVLEKGGAKLFGAMVPGTDKFGPVMKRAMDMLPESVVKPAVEGATKMRDGMIDMLGGVFSKEGALRVLPQPIRERAVRLTNDMFRSSGAHRTRLLAQVDNVERQFNAMFKKGSAREEAWERWTDIREGTGTQAFKSADEEELFNQTMALYDSMGATGLEAGILRPEQMLPNYMSRSYKNVEDLNQYHPRPGVKIEPGNTAKFQKVRRFETTRDAIRISRELHDQSVASVGKRNAEGLYPILEPDWDVFKNLRQYVGSHSDALARKAWIEEMTEQFAININDIPGFDHDALYDEVLRKAKVNAKGPDWFNPDNVPLRRAIDEFDIEDTLVDIFGEDGARYVAVKGTTTGDELVFLPKEIAKSLESVNSSLFNTADYKEFGKFLKGYDWFNNNFKWGVYVNPIWVASRVRNAYSNMSQSALRIGAAAINPSRHVDAINLMAGKNLAKEFADSGFTIGELRDMFKTLGIWVPGKVFVESTGKFKLGKFRTLMTDASAAVENEARVLLALEEIRRGASPRAAADTVGEFLFNYGEMSRIERDLFRRVFPFFTFTRKNVELQVKALKRNPGLVINQIKPFRGRDQENEQMVSWEGEALKLRLDKDGKTLSVMTGIDLPLRNLDNLWAGGFGETGRRIMGMMTPAIKTPVELVTNRDTFTGRTLTRSRADTLGRIVEVTRTPQAVKNWLGYKKEVDEAGRPKYTMDGARYSLLVRSWMFSRFFSTSDRQFREYLNSDDPNLWKALLDVSTGLRMKDINMDEQERAKLFRRRRQLQDVLARRGAGRPFEVFGRPDTEGL